MTWIETKHLACFSRLLKRNSRREWGKWSRRTLFIRRHMASRTVWILTTRNMCIIRLTLARSPWPFRWLPLQMITAACSSQTASTRTLSSDWSYRTEARATIFKSVRHASVTIINCSCSRCEMESTNFTRATWSKSTISSGRTSSWSNSKMMSKCWSSATMTKHRQETLESLSLSIQMLTLSLMMRCKFMCVPPLTRKAAKLKKASTRNCLCSSCTDRRCITGCKMARARS